MRKTFKEHITNPYILFKKVGSITHSKGVQCRDEHFSLSFPNQKWPFND